MAAASVDLDHLLRQQPRSTSAMDWAKGSIDVRRQREAGLGDSLVVPATGSGNRLPSRSSVDLGLKLGAVIKTRSSIFLTSPDSSHTNQFLQKVNGFEVISLRTFCFRQNSFACPVGF